MYVCICTRIIISGYMKTLSAERRVDLIRAAASFPPLHNQPFPEHALSKNPGKHYFFAVIFWGDITFSNLLFTYKTNVLVDFLLVRNQAVVQVQ